VIAARRCCLGCAETQTRDLTIEVSYAIDQGRSQVRDDGMATTVMLGLSGFRVLAVSEHDGDVEQAVETTADEGWCPSCGVRAWSTMSRAWPTIARSRSTTRCAASGIGSACTTASSTTSEGLVLYERDLDRLQADNNELLARLAAAGAVPGH
jgi:hypothetical protein